MKFIKSFITIALVTLSNYAFAGTSGVNIVYGEDSRIETFQASEKLQALASSTAGMFETANSVNIGTHTMLPVKTLDMNYGLCSSERFRDQPSSVTCSGFLVGPDLLVTAGHCIQDQDDCNSVSWIFDFKVNESNLKANTLVSNDKIFRCSKVIESKLISTKSGRKKDYSLIKLDRVVESAKPLQYRDAGEVSLMTDIFVIGHPSGLPQKIATDAKVLENSHPDYFQTNLDTFGGNSGSAVFDEKTGLVEGILVRGAMDYEESMEGCMIVHQVDSEIDDFTRYGESVSRITEIKTLKYRNEFLEAASLGDIFSFESLAKLVFDMDITDNELNTAMHFAAKSNSTDIIELLINKGANINLQNSKGETPLHIAAFYNSKNAINLLLENNANILIKDSNGLLPSQRSMYLAFKTRRTLRRAEKSQAIK